MTHTVTFFESPHRIATTLKEASLVLVERQIMVGREITKLHQEFLRGTAASVSDRLNRVKGEITVVVGPLEDGDSAGKPPRAEDTAGAVEHFDQLTNIEGLERRAAITATARKFKMSSRAIYAAVEKAKTSVE